MTEDQIYTKRDLEIERSIALLGSKLDAVHVRIDDLYELLQKQNCRLAALEEERARRTGAMAVLSVLCGMIGAWVLKAVGSKLF